MVDVDCLAVLLGLDIRTLHALEVSGRTRRPWLAVSDYMLLHCWVGPSSDTWYTC
jgi:hypothetical protein